MVNYFWWYWGFMHINIDDECTRIIAKRQPAGGGLRLITAIVKTIAALERIGD